MKLKYKYLIYKIYSWSVSKKGDTPIANTILTLAITHFFQFLTLLLFIDRLFVPLNLFSVNNRIHKAFLLLGMGIYFVIFYFIVYNKERWNAYLEEYKSENDQQRKRGNRLVIFYLVISILVFFISLPVLFTLGKHLHDS